MTNSTLLDSSASTDLTTTSPLVLENIGVTYPDGDSTLEVLRGVSVAPRVGELSALTGVSGSGKSTMLTVSALLTRPTVGRVLVAGQDAWSLNEKERTALRRDNVGLVFQQPNLFASLNAREQLAMSADIRGELGSGVLGALGRVFGKGGSRADKPAAFARADELLDLVGLSDKRDRLPHQLSGGQRQRVNIARALMNSPKVILADEPTSALDEDMSAQIVGLLGKVTRELNVATLMVTHDTAQLDQCDTVYALERGVLSELR